MLTENEKKMRKVKFFAGLSLAAIFTAAAAIGGLSTVLTAVVGGAVGGISGIALASRGKDEGFASIGKTIGYAAVGAAIGIATGIGASASLTA